MHYKKIKQIEIERNSPEKHDEQCICERGNVWKVCQLNCKKITLQQDRKRKEKRKKN